MTAPFTAPSPVDSTRGRVLVVDDDRAISQFVSVALARLGHSAATASGVDDALDKLRRGTFEVVLVDLVMPGRSGLDLLDTIRTTGMPVVPILLSGTADVPTAVAGMKSGAFDYIAKPPDLEVLGFAVKRALALSHARQRERALERVVLEWEVTFDACPDLLLVLGPNGRVLRANEATARRTGVERERLVGRPFDEIFPGPLGAAVLGAAPDTAFADVVVFDALLDAHFLLSVIPIQTAPSAHALVVAVRDVTRLVRSENERRKLLRQLLTAQEDERRRLARELHDGIGQALVTLSVGLATLCAPEHTEPLAACAPRLHRVAADTLEEVRRLAHGLRPASLDDLGLVAALGRLTEVFTRVHGVRAELLVPGAPTERLPPEVESAVYRIVQEALANVAKHARAKTVDVVLEMTATDVRASVTDDGTGFDPAHPAGFGTRGMHERAQLLGGEFRIESIPGRGTIVTARIPLKEVT